MFLELMNQRIGGETKKIKSEKLSTSFIVRYYLYLMSNNLIDTAMLALCDLTHSLSNSFYCQVFVTPLVDSFPSVSRPIRNLVIPKSIGRPICKGIRPKKKKKISLRTKNEGGCNQKQMTSFLIFVAHIFQTYFKMPSMP